MISVLIQVPECVLMNYTCDTVNCFSSSAFFFKLISRASVLENILHKIHVPVFTNFYSTVYFLFVQREILGVGLKKR